MLEIATQEKLQFIYLFFFFCLPFLIIFAVVALFCFVVVLFCFVAVVVVCGLLLGLFLHTHYHFIINFCNLFGLLRLFSQLSE